MIDDLRNKQKQYSKAKRIEEQKVLGQYFTDAPIAQFMSSLINTNHLNADSVKILDCGAGYGMLTSTTALHLLESGFINVDATLYEIDSEIIEHLNSVLLNIQKKFTETGGKFTFEIISEDFITTRPDITKSKKFDIAVINPPYFKYSVKESKYAKKTADLYKGDPNIYASFIAVTLSCLELLGQTIVISPRSFLNGLYFKGFRKYILRNSSLDRIHIFKSRKDVFVDSDILQENIIFKLTKNEQRSNHIAISTSIGLSDLDEPTLVTYPIHIIIDGSNSEEIIRIPENRSDFEVLHIAENLPSTFTNEGYCISTGPVVEHRTREYHSKDHGETNQVPLIKAHNVFIEGISWDGLNRKDLSFKLINQHDKHLLRNERYIILKRFTSKDEKRRLVAGIYNSIDGINSIAITNKLNYIYRKDEMLSNEEALGLVVLFNSKFYDNYYRCISGNTQVNATDIRIMKTPTRDQIINLGNLIRDAQNLSYDRIEELIEEITHTTYER